MFYQRGVSSFKFGVPCFVVKKLKAIVRFWRRNIRKLSHVIKGRSDFYSSLTFLSEIWRELLINNSMNRWILSSPRNVGTHLNWCEVVMDVCTSEATVVAKWWKSEMNHKISVYYNVDWRVVIHPFLALIVQCRYGLFAPKFCTNTILNSWVTTCQGIVQYANRSQETLC